MIEPEDLLRPEEHDLVGQRLDLGNRIEGDAVCDRVNALIVGHLARVATSEDGWDILYRDPSDGRFWELTYPQSELHGGGPPRLTHLPPADAARKYGIDAL